MDSRPVPGIGPEGPTHPTAPSLPPGPTELSFCDFFLRPRLTVHPSQTEFAQIEMEQRVCPSLATWAGIQPARTTHKVRMGREIPSRRGRTEITLPQRRFL